MLRFILRLIFFGFGAKVKVELKFVAPGPGEYELTLYCICDSYVGCDQVKFIKNFC